MGSGGNRAYLLAVGALKGVGLHVDEVHEAAEVVLEADRHLHRRAVVAQLVADLADDPPRCRAGAVALVDERDARYPVPPHLAVHRDGLRLHAPCTLRRGVREGAWVRAGGGGVVQEAVGNIEEVWSRVECNC